MVAREYPFGLSFDVYRSSLDGAIVIHIETDDDSLPCNTDGPAPLRVYINDDTDNPIYENKD